MNGDAIHLQAGSAAPDFILPDQNGADHALSDYHGDWVLLCFYPKDDVVKCAKELCGLRDHFVEFKKLGIRVFGISADSIENHRAFAARNNIPFMLLSDVRKKTIEQYEASPTEHYSDGNEEVVPTSFLVNLVGEIEKIYSRIKPEKHAGEVLTDFRKMQEEDQEDKDSIWI